MWLSKGRSGIGDKSIEGTYEDWTGLSPNGRQFRNILTEETRNLSGAEYWHARKANSYAEAEDTEIPTYINGIPNIKGFADKPKAASKAKPKDIASSIDLANRHLERMQALSDELDNQLIDNLISPEQYRLLRYKMDIRLQKAWERLEKDNSPFWEEEEARKEAVQSVKKDEKKLDNLEAEGLSLSTVISNLRDDNLFKVAYIKYKQLRGMFK